MRTQIFGAAFCCALSAAAAAQTATDLRVPPAREELPDLPPPPSRAAWPAEARDGAFIEASVRVSPRTGLPVEGVGRPLEAPDDAPPASSALRPLGRGPGSPSLPSAASGPPRVDDLAIPAPYQPVMQGFEGIGPNGETPPCPDLAAGYGHVVTVTNDDFATYDRAGHELFRADIHDYLGVSTNYVMSEPKVIFDPWHGRWVMLYHKTRDATEESSLAIIVTETSQPFGLGNWYWYDFNAVQTGTSGQAFAQYFDLGFSPDYLTLGGNMFHFSGGFLWSRIWVLDKAEVYNAVGATPLRSSGMTNPDGTATFTPRAVEMQTGWNEGGQPIDGTWINSRSGGGDMLTHWKIQDAFGANIVTRVDIPVGSYSVSGSAVQPDGRFLHTMECRLMPAVTTIDTYGSNGIELFTSLTTDRSGYSGLHLFKIDPIANVSEWEASYGASGLDYWFGSVAADFSGSAFWVFARTGNSAGNEPEIRFVDYAHGVLNGSSQQLRDGDGCYGGWHWGYYFGGQLDWGDFAHTASTPGSPSKVWLYGEYGEAESFGTYVGATSVFDQGDLSSVTPTSTWVVSGSTGGPFTPANRAYTLTNSGDVGLVYEVTSLPPWLDATPPLGQLFPGTTQVTLSVNATASWLSPGVYSDSVVFEDVFNGGNSYSRPVQLTVSGDGVVYCTGNPGSGTACPCNNDNDGSLPDAGCANGSFASGAKLVALGHASVSADTVVLTATHLDPGNSALYFQGNIAVNSGQGNVFGDGLRCAGGGLVRLQVRFSSSSGTSQTTIPIAAKGFVSPGDVKRYQCWYRDTSGHQPCGAGVNDFNLTNGYRLTWGP